MIVLILAIVSATVISMGMYDIKPDGLTDEVVKCFDENEKVDDQRTCVDNLKLK
jgi:hypothetical protein